MLEEYPDRDLHGRRNHEGGSMRLVGAHIRGLGRLVDTEINLDQRVVAIVGPNEAGKSTLLKGLAYVDSRGAIPAAERSRASTTITDETPITRLHYKLSESDQERLAGFDLEEAPTDFFVSRLADGEGPVFEARPQPRRNKAPLRRLSSDLGEVTSRRAGGIRSLATEADERQAARSAVKEALADLHSRIETYLASSLDRSQEYKPIQQRAKDLRAVVEQGFTGTEHLLPILDGLSQWDDQPDLGDSVHKELWNITPDVVMFGDPDRALASSYALGEELVNNTPPALENLLRLAGLNLNALVTAVLNGDIGRRDTLKNTANKRLTTVFTEAWRQSTLTVNLNVEGSTLRIGLLEGESYAYQFHERSAGLRMFVAITAFLATRDTGRPTILLIDEAETHLHIDAQADLVQMFTEQDKADKIIYTTHSPACLPSDLGVGIRAVVPVADEASRIENHYWRLEGAGFTSLMVALGASAAAFTPARCAVIGEGATEMILLPTLMREATGLDSLPYQVTPGLSEIPPEAYPDLDFQAAKVAFLVDGDSGGSALSKRVGRVVPNERIGTLSVCGIENTLDTDTYQRAYLAVLADLNPTAAIGKPPVLPDPEKAPWSKAMESWAKEGGLRVACKRDVANYIIELERVDLSEIGRAALRNAHLELLAALELAHDQLTAPRAE